MKAHRKNYTRLIATSVVGFAMTMVLILTMSTSAPVNPLRSSVLFAAGNEYVAERDEDSDEVDEEERTLEEELEFINAGERELLKLQKNLKGGLKTSLARMEKKYVKKSLISLYEKMQEALQPVCAYREAFAETIGEKCEVLGNYIEDYNRIDVKKVILPLVRNFMKAFSDRFFKDAIAEIAEYRTELREMISEESAESDDEDEE